MIKPPLAFLDISLLVSLLFHTCKKERQPVIDPGAIYGKKWQMTEAWYRESDGIRHNNLSPLDFERDNYIVFYSDSTFIEYENTLTNPLDTSAIVSRGTWKFADNNTNINRKFEYIKLVPRNYSFTDEIVELSDAKFQTHRVDVSWPGGGETEVGSAYVAIP